jgi:N-acylneuraminate cytidylyltransferase
MPPLPTDRATSEPDAAPSDRTGAVVAVIPARGGSKRIPRKNIRPFHGRPMLAWSIGAAKASGLFGRIVISTDDDEIAAVARNWGAETPFVRPPELADDHTPTPAVVRHAIEALGGPIAYVCCLYPTAPLMQARYLREGFEALKTRPDKSFALGVTSFAFPVQRAVRISADGGLEALYPQYRETRSQDLEPAYHDAGQFCWGRAEAWLRGDVIFSGRTLPVILPRRLVQDIDTLEDWETAERLFEIEAARPIAGATL